MIVVVNFNTLIRTILSKNRLQNVIEQLDGRREFPRLSIGTLLCLCLCPYYSILNGKFMELCCWLLCIGIGNPPGKMDTRAFLLQKFSSEERVQVLLLLYV